MVEPKAQEEASVPEFAIQRLYLKDLSLESPNAPQIFLDNWEPELSLDLETKANALADDSHEVILTVTVSVKIKNKTAFLVEVTQAGIFSIKGFPEDQIRPMLGSFCPNILYPYAREAVTDVVIKAGFPQLYLTPVNFDALLSEHDKNQLKEEGDGEAGGSQSVH